MSIRPSRSPSRYSPGSRPSVPAFAQDPRSCPAPNSGIEKRSPEGARLLLHGAQAIRTFGNEGCTVLIEPGSLDLNRPPIDAGAGRVAKMKLCR